MVIHEELQSPWGVATDQSDDWMEGSNCVHRTGFPWQVLYDATHKRLSGRLAIHLRSWFDDLEGAYSDPINPLLDYVLACKQAVERERRRADEAELQVAHSPAYLEEAAGKAQELIASYFDQEPGMEPPGPKALESAAAVLIVCALRDRLPSAVSWSGEGLTLDYQPAEGVSAEYVCGNSGEVFIISRHAGKLPADRSWGVFQVGGGAAEIAQSTWAAVQSGTE